MSWDTEPGSWGEPEETNRQIPSQTWDTEPGSWGEPEEMNRQMPSQTQDYYPQYDQRISSREFHRSNSDYQSNGPRGGYTNRQPTHRPNYESTGYSHQINHGPRSHHRNYGRDGGYYYSNWDQEYNPSRNHHPRQHYPRQPRESDYPGDQGCRHYSPPHLYQEREHSGQHRGSRPHFNYRDRGHHTRDLHNYSNRYNAKPSGYNPNNANDQEVEYKNPNRDEQTQNFPRSPLDRQKSEPLYPLSRLPKARSRCSSTSSEHSTSRNDCVICYGSVTYLAVTPCGHSYCHLCCVRLQILCDDHHCPICRTPFEEDNPVILLPLPTFTPVYSELIVSSRLCEKYNIALIPPLTNRIFDQLFDLKCPVDQCEYFSRNDYFGNLDKHLRVVHEQHYCYVCLYGLKQFVFEMRLYSREELNLHKDGKGDSRLDPPGHKGHPLCRFCKERLLDEPSLYEHLHKNHFWCYICERNGIHMYYQNQDELRGHFKQEHFLCERGECRNEVLTSVFSTLIDLKAHVASVHAGDLKKNEAKNLRRVDLEFNYTLPSHQTAGDQGYRYRKQPRGGRGQDRRKDPVSDDDEMNLDNFEVITDSNQSEFTFESDDHSNTKETPHTIDSNAGASNDDRGYQNYQNRHNAKLSGYNANDQEVAYNNQTKPVINCETEAPILEPSTDNADIWPQVGDKKSSAVTATTNPKPTTAIPIHGPTESAFSYSKSLGLVQPHSIQSHVPKQAPKVSQVVVPSPYLDAVKPESKRAHKVPSQNKDSSQEANKQTPKISQVVVPSPYSDAVKPESKRVHKIQSQNKDSQEANKQTPKQTYEDIFPALCTTSVPVIPTQIDMPQNQSNTAIFPHAKTGKKSNKQRKKDYKPNQTPSIQSNVSSSHTSNAVESTVNFRQPPPPKDRIVSQSAKIKKQLSPSRSRKVNPTEHHDKTATQFDWVPPHNCKQRKSALDAHIRSMSKINSLISDYDSKYQGMLDRSHAVRDFFQFCVNAFGSTFSTIFPELLVLVPDISLQQELLRAKEKFYPSAVFLAFPSSSSSWSNQAHIELVTCPICSQVVLPSDLLLHNGSHSTDNEFPALC